MKETDTVSDSCTEQLLDDSQHDETSVLAVQRLQRVENFDCRMGMEQLDKQSVSLILTDPPYFTDGMDDRWSHQKLRSRVKPGVIGSLPAGMKFDKSQGSNLYAFCRQLPSNGRR